MSAARCWCSHGHCGCDWPTRHPCETCDCCHSFTQRTQTPVIPVLAAGVEDSTDTKED